ncbi:MAG: hypothetical protein ACOY0S_02250 [Patescibacteria group bacterium]
MDKIINNKAKFLLFGIVILAGFFRLWNLSAAMGWWGDIARDYLVAYHLAFWGESLQIGHYATGIADGFFHPPYYYYFLSWLVRIYESPVFVVGFFAFFHALSVFTIYGIAKNFAGSVAGIIAGSLFATSIYMIRISQAPISANASIPLVLLAWWWQTQSLKEPRYQWLAPAATLVLLIAGAFWYGNLLLLPYFLVSWGIKYWRQKPLMMVLILVVLVGPWLIFLPLNAHFGKDVLYAKLSWKTNIEVSSLWPAHFWRVFTSYIETLLGLHKLSVFSGIGTVILLWLTVALKNHSDAMTVSQPLLILPFVMVVLGLKKGVFLSHYLNQIIPVYFVLAGSVLAMFLRVFRRSPIVPYIILVVFIGLTYFLSDRFGFWRQLPRDYQRSRQLAGEIERLSSAAGERISFIIHDKDEPPGWENPTVWYFLEKKHGRLLRLVNEGNNLAEISPAPLSIWICKISDGKPTPGCLTTLYTYTPGVKIQTEYSLPEIDYHLYSLRKQL